MGTYVEDYLESMQMLPSEIKRNFDLMRDLDKVHLTRFFVFPLVSVLIAFFSSPCTDIVPTF